MVTSVGVLGVSTGNGGGVSGRLVSTASREGCVEGLAVVSTSPPKVNLRLVKLLPRLSGRDVCARIPWRLSAGSVVVPPERERADLSRDGDTELLESLRVTRIGLSRDSKRVKLRERLVVGFDGLRVSRMPLEKALRSSADNSLVKAGLS
jgi:hypothetical protein